jgi:hypothetical protein
VPASGTADHSLNVGSMSLDRLLGTWNVSMDHVALLDAEHYHYFDVRGINRRSVCATRTRGSRCRW